MFFGTPPIDMPEVSAEPKAPAPTASIPDAPAAAATRTQFRQETGRIQASDRPRRRGGATGGPADSALAAMATLAILDVLDS